MATTSSVVESKQRQPSLVAPLLAGVPVLLLVLWGLGALSEQDIPGLPVVPLATLWSLPLDLWVRDIATALTVGFALVGGVLAPRPDPRSGRNASLAALVWLAALLVQSVFTVSEVLALPVSDSLNPTIIWSLLTQTTLGRVIVIQFLIVAFIAILAWVVLGRVTGIIIAAAAMVATFLPGFTGHSGIEEGHSSATISLGLHVIAASVWVGGLVATVDYVRRSAPQASQVLQRFSVVALICVIVLVQSGLINASLRLDGVSSLITSTYGAVILAKISIVIVLIGFGWRQRQDLSRRYDEDGSNKRLLVQLSAWELAWMGAAFGLSVALARTAPPGVPIASDPATFAAIGLLTLAIPLAVRSVVPAHRWPSTPRVLREYPEAVAVLVVVGMVVASTVARAGTGNQQLVSLFLAAMLVALGLAFWTVMGDRRAIPALVIVAAGVPLVAWWNERGLTGGLGVTTALVTALLWGVLAMGARPVARGKEEEAAEEVVQA